MRKHDWQKLELDKGMLREPSSDPNRLILWIPEMMDRCWERVSIGAGAEITEEQGICSTAATSILASQKREGFLGGLLRRFRQQSEAQTWILPNGQMAEQIGPRRNDLLLVWSEDDSGRLEEVRIKSRWPKGETVRRIAANLFLVRGVELANTVEEVNVPSPTQEATVSQAEEMLVAARRAGDIYWIVTALTDLGIVLTRQRQPQPAVAMLEEALTLVRQFGNRALESDVLDNLGMAVLAAGQPGRALELFQQGLEGARAAGDQFAEKMALFHLGLAYLAGRDLNQAFGFLEQALNIARQLGDREHEADLLWQLGIVHAEAGQRDQAVARCQEAVDLFKQMGNPQVDWLENQLQKFRRGETGTPMAAVAQATGASAPFFGGQIVTGGWTDQGFMPSQAQGRSGPGLLRMAFSAMKSMAQFAGSGFKATPASTYQKRLQACGQCPHHTGLRCKLCGCFTSVKAWMPHERCPIGKWAG